MYSSVSSGVLVKETIDSIFLFNEIFLFFFNIPSEISLQGFEKLKHLMWIKLKCLQSFR